MAQNDYDGLEHGALMWLPPKQPLIGRDHKQTKEQFGIGVQQARRHGIKSPPSAEMNSALMGQSRYDQRAQRPKNESNWASNGSGMQAVFLGSNPRSCGTGVFIPRTDGSGFSNKPGVSSVLLPARVVQALNLNVHELSEKIKPQPEVHKNTAKKTHEKNNMADVICVSPDIFLPKEWTY